MSLQLKKRSSYSWDRSGIRKVQFDALKAGEKIGFSLGGDGHRQEIVSVKEGTQSYWKGIKTGYVIVSVNGIKVDAITVKTAIRDACKSGSSFNVGMSTGTPTEAVKKPSKNKSSSRLSGRVKVKPAAKIKEPVLPAEDSKEEEKAQGYNDEKPIIDNGAYDFQEELDIGGWFAGDEDAEDYTPIAKR